jgi:hypothetical protein
MLRVGGSDFMLGMLSSLLTKKNAKEKSFLFYEKGGDVLFYRVKIRVGGVRKGGWGYIGECRG